MSDTIVDQTVFLTLVRTTGERACARILIDSIRSFGGVLSHCPIWLFEADPQKAPCKSMGRIDVQIFSLSVPDTMRHYYYADKVYACAQAEELVAPRVQSLIWREDHREFYRSTLL